MQQAQDQSTNPRAAHAVSAYREEHVNNLSQKELLLMLYDGAIQFCMEARTAIEAKDFSTSYDKLVRARSVVSELLSILNGDLEADVVSNLRRLYDFCIYGITETNFTKDLSLLDGVLRVLHNLRGAWAEIDFQAAVRELTAEAEADTPTPPIPDNAPTEPDSTEDVSEPDAVPASNGLSLTA